MMSILLVFAGGGLGAVMRFLIGPAIQSMANGLAFPIGTFVVNVTGCLIIGALAGLAESRSLFTLELRQFVFVGILGGYTTFSSFGLETFQLLRDGQVLYAVLNVTLQVALGMLLLWLGFSVTRSF